MFEVDVQGLAELEGGRSPFRLACEPIANAFDEFRGYGGDRKRPTHCAVSLVFSPNPRGVVLTVEDNGAGFEKPEHAWTLFAPTAKRSEPGVAGRFNCGDKQLCALAREATIVTNATTIRFADGQRRVTPHRSIQFEGVRVECLMPWTREVEAEVREHLRRIIPPIGMAYTVDGAKIERPALKCSVNVTLPTVVLTDGVLKTTTRKTRVDVLAPADGGPAMLYELGIPVCELPDFAWSLDVWQKVPLPLSRDMVTPAYAARLIGSVLEHAAMDGHKLLTEEQQGAGFVKDALEWVREPEALAATVKALYGENVVRQSSDPIANAQAAAAGATILPGRWFGADTRKRLESSGIVPTSKQQYGGAENLRQPAVKVVCPNCGHELQ